MTERLNKVLAQLGYGSRRSCDSLIAAGKVTVNGHLATVGQQVTPEDRITLEGRPITRRPKETVILAFNKPKGVTTTKKDPFAPVTVMDFLPPHYQHLYPVGRLDKNSRGLLLLTNDGDLALKLEHPRYSHEKEYEVMFTPRKKVSHAQFQSDMKKLTQEVVHYEFQSKPITITAKQFDETKQLGHVTVVLTEGKKRQIRELFKVLGYEVIDLLRTRIGALKLATLKEGEYSVINRDAVLKTQSDTL